MELLKSTHDANGNLHIYSSPLQRILRMSLAYYYSSAFSPQHAPDRKSNFHAIPKNSSPAHNKNNLNRKRELSPVPPMNITCRSRLTMRPPSPLRKSEDLLSFSSTKWGKTTFKTTSKTTIKCYYGASLNRSEPHEETTINALDCHESTVSNTPLKTVEGNGLLVDIRLRFLVREVLPSYNIASFPRLTGELSCSQTTVQITDSDS